MTQRAPDRATTSYFAGENVDLEILPSKGDQADIVLVCNQDSLLSPVRTRLELSVCSSNNFCHPG